MAGPLATASRQPRLPHEQSTSGACGASDVAEVACRAHGSAVQAPAADDAGADAGRDLDEEEVLDVGVGDGVLAERHDVDVVVDEHGHVEDAGHVSRHVVAVPPGHDRRAHRSAARVLHGAGHADADADEVGGGASGEVEHLRGRRGHPVEHDRGAVGDLEVLTDLAERSPREVGDSDATVGGAEVGADDDARLGVEGEPDGGRPPVEARLAARRQQAAREQGVDSSADGRTREPGQLGQLGPRAWRLVAQQLKQLTGAVRGRRGMRGLGRCSLSK